MVVSDYVNLVCRTDPIILNQAILKHQLLLTCIENVRYSIEDYWIC